MKDTEMSLLESVTARKHKFFGHVMQKLRTRRKISLKVPWQEQKYEEHHAQLCKTTLKHGQRYHWWKQRGQEKTVHSGKRLSKMQPNLILLRRVKEQNRAHQDHQMVYKAVVAAMLQQPGHHHFICSHDMTTCNSNNNNKDQVQPGVEQNAPI